MGALAVRGLLTPCKLHRASRRRLPAPQRPATNARLPTCKAEGKARCGAQTAWTVAQIAASTGAARCMQTHLCKLALRPEAQTLVGCACLAALQAVESRCSRRVNTPFDAVFCLQNVWNWLAACLPLPAGTRSIPWGAASCRPPLPPSLACLARKVLTPRMRDRWAGDPSCHDGPSSPWRSKLAMPSPGRLSVQSRAARCPRQGRARRAGPPETRGWAALAGVVAAAG